MRPAAVSSTLAAASAAVVAWALAVAWKLATQVQAGELAKARSAILIAHQVMGLVFLVCGWAVWQRLRDASGALFAFYGVAAALHWAGPIQADSAALRTALLVVFFLVSSTLGEAFLLHFTLRFPKRLPVLGRRTLWALYGPLAPAAAISLAIVVLVSLGRDPGALQAPFALFAPLLPNLFGLLAIVVLVVRWRRAAPAERRRDGLTVMAFGNIVAVLPWMAVAAAALLAPGVSIPGGLGTDP